MLLTKSDHCSLQKHDTKQDKKARKCQISIITKLHVILKTKIKHTCNPLASTKVSSVINLSLDL